MEGEIPKPKKCEGCPLANTLETAIKLNRQMYLLYHQKIKEKLVKLEKFNLN